MPKPNQEVVGFTFQEIPLEEALNVVLSGDGNYAEVKQILLEKLPQLTPDKAFAFGLPGGKEIPEDQRRGLCMAVNATLRKAKIYWHVTYSGTKKIFICIPKIKKAPGEKQKNQHTADTSEDDTILALRAKGMTANEIAKQVATPLSRIKYLCYQVAVGRRKAQPAMSSNGHSSPMSAAQLIELARNTFNYSGDFQDDPGKLIRRAISAIALKDLALSPKHLAPFLGMTPDGIYWNAHYSKANKAAVQISELRKAVKQEA